MQFLNKDLRVIIQAEFPKAALDMGWESEWDMRTANIGGRCKWDTEKDKTRMPSIQITQDGDDYWRLHMVSAGGMAMVGLELWYTDTDYVSICFWPNDLSAMPPMVEDLIHSEQARQKYYKTLLAVWDDAEAYLEKIQKELLAIEYLQGLYKNDSKIMDKLKPYLDRKPDKEELDVCYVKYADGFGRGAGAVMDGFDWSHIRDSSMKAGVAMFNYLAKRNPNLRAAIVTG